MIPITVQWIDPQPNLCSGQQPVWLMERPLLHGDNPKGPGYNAAEVARCGDFWVPQSSLVEEPAIWTVTRQGPYVRVPVFAYRTASRHASSILATGMEIGLAAILLLGKHTTEVPLRIKLVLGHPCTDLFPEDAYRCYVGMCMQTKE